MRSLLLMLLFITSVSADMQEPAWIVIASGSADSTEAHRLYEKHLASRHVIHLNHSEQWQFPLFTKSDNITGLNKGFWITVPVITEHKKVALEAVRHLQHTTGEGYAKQVQVYNVPDIRAVRADSLKAYYRWEDGDGPGRYFDISWIDLSPGGEEVTYAYWLDGYGILDFYSYDDSLEGTEAGFSGMAESCMVGHSIPFRNDYVWRLPPITMDAACW